MFYKVKVISNTILIRKKKESEIYCSLKKGYICIYMYMYIHIYIYIYVHPGLIQNPVRSKVCNR